jgi:hypothetical protein
MLSRIGMLVQVTRMSQRSCRKLNIFGLMIEQLLDSL